MLKAVLFDFDGVIADSEMLHYNALNEVFKLYGVNVPKEVHWQKYLGLTDRENIIAVSKDYKMGIAGRQVEGLVKQKALLFKELALKKAPIFDGVAGLVAELVRHGIHRGICSGATAADIKIMLAGSGLEDAFEAVVAAEDVEKGKPDPAGYLLCLRWLQEKTGENILPQQCAVIEDSHWGLEAATTAGMHRAAVTTSYGPEKLAEKAEVIVKTLKDLKIEDLHKICQKIP